MSAPDRLMPWSPLADKIEASIKTRAREAVDAALDRARDAAFRAYADALRSVTGLPFEVELADFLHEAERGIRAAAIETRYRSESEAVVRRLAEDSA